jgi:hypothetical protein
VLIRERKESKNVCTSLRYRNWVRKGNDSGFSNASGTMGTSYEADSEFVGEGADDASTGRLVQYRERIEWWIGYIMTCRGSEPDGAEE